MAINFNNSAYIRSHGRNPKGRGSWAFADNPNPDTNTIVFSPGNMTLTEAKRWFRQYLATHYADVNYRQVNVNVYILP